MPHFSIVVPAFNASATLGETLDSLIAQEYLDWECVVVDDGSTDDTAAIARDFVQRDPRFRLISQENTGCAGAYRAGVAAASADLLIICAADDYLLPDHLQAMYDFIGANPDYDIYSSNGELLYEETGLRRVAYWQPQWQQERSMSFEEVIAECFFGVGAVFRRSLYELSGGHRAGVYVDDYDLWLRSMARGALHRYTPQVLSVHRVSNFQQSANMVRVYESTIEVYENLLAEPGLQPTQVDAIKAGIARNRQLIADAPVQRALEQQYRQVLGLVHRLVGPRHAEPVMRAIHWVARIVRPVRRFVVRLTTRRG